MNPLSALNLMLRNIAARCGVEKLELDDNGTRTLDYQDTTVCLEYLESALCLRLYAPLASVPAIVAQEQVGDFWRALLSANLSHPDLLGAHFGMHPREDLVILVLQVPVEHLDEDVLEGHLNNFLLLVESWSRKLAGGAALQALLTPMGAQETEALSEYLLGLPEPINEPIQPNSV